MENVEVKIERHKGVRSVAPGITAEVDLGQWRIFVNGQCAGYVADEANSHISLLGSYSEIPAELAAFIKSEVDRLRGVVAPTLVQARDFQSANVQLVEDTEPLS